MKKGFLHIVLHSHLPFVLSHGTWPHGADWVFEAACETYIPLLQQLRRAEREGVPLHFTIGISPVLAEQLAHLSFPASFMDYLRMKIDAALEDEKYFVEIDDAPRVKLAQMWQDFYTHILHDFEDIGGDIIGEFKRFKNIGAIEIITCGATHGYMPLLGTDNSVNAQIATAVRYHKKHFGDEPKGIWLPEAAYRPRYEWVPPVGNDKTPRMRRGVEEFLYRHDLKFFFVDSHLMKGGKALGVYIDRFEALRRLWTQFEKHYVEKEELPRSLYKPYLASSNNGASAVGVFARDPDTGMQVWSGKWGYPGNGAYLDFHKKNFPGGHRYWRVTDSQADLADKKLYDPSVIDSILYEQANHFRKLVENIVEQNTNVTNMPPIVTAPFDTELFGHWWFEGTRWLFELAREFGHSHSAEMTSAWNYLAQNPPAEVINMPEGSWGQGGFHYIWLNDMTKWTWEHLYRAENKMRDFANRWVANPVDVRLRRVLSQLGRELLLMESSDWQFLISTFAASDYAEMRFSFHKAKFDEVCDIAEELFAGKEPLPGKWRELELLEVQDDLFSQLDPAVWADSQLAAVSSI